MRPILPASAAALLTACATQPLPQPTHTYGCDGNVGVVKAAYPNASTAYVTFQSGNTTTTYTLRKGASATGSKYLQDPRREATPNHLVWWVKGTEAILYKTAAASGPYVYEKQLATCTLSYQSE